MAVTLEAIEAAERQAQLNREALSRGEAVMPISIGMEPRGQEKPPRISFTRKIKGKTVVLVMTAVELAASEGVETYVRRLRVEQTRSDCGTQCRVVTFEPPAIIRETGIFLPVPTGRGRQRFKTPAQPFDPLVVFDGSPAARRTIKELRALGVSFR